MSRISKEVNKMNNEIEKNVVTNFMGGDCYKLNPLETLKMIAASSIFGEAQFYRSNNTRAYKITSHTYDCVPDIMFREFDGLTTEEIFVKAINDSLYYDFEETLKLAVVLRSEYYMRLNPNIIMVHAAIHPERKKWTEEHPGKFSEYQNLVMLRGDDPLIQVTYYLYLNNGEKNDMPSILKRSIAKNLSCQSPFSINKYKNSEIGMINAVRIVHAKSNTINELMQTGKVEVDASEETWEQKRSKGMSWEYILATTHIHHMALLRNLRNIFSEEMSFESCTNIIHKLVAGVKQGMQFPYRYMSAYNRLSLCGSEVYFKSAILDALEECIDESTNMLDEKYHLKGTTICLSDNSGSAWGTFNSEFGRQTVAEIGNLSSVITSKCSDVGYVGKFGDNLHIIDVSKRTGVLRQTRYINKGYSVGKSTEGGIWHFFRDAIDNKTWYDNIFIFSDMQAGTGGLYGSVTDRTEYESEYGMKSIHGRNYNINVYKLILKYRSIINPKVNVFCVQTAGYDNALVPALSYRCAILTGWTGKEVQFASEYIKQWDEIEQNRE